MVNDATFQKTSVHKVIAVRLIVNAIIIATVVTFIVLINERNKVGEMALGRVLQAATYFSIQARNLLDEPGLKDHTGIQRELELFVSVRRSARTVTPLRKLGHFVYADILDMNFQGVAQFLDKEYHSLTAVKNFMKIRGVGLSADREASYDIVRAGGRPHVIVFVPLIGSQGDVVAYLSGVFAISEDTIAQAKGKMIRTIFTVVFIILLTTALLYPIIITLMKRLARLALNLLDSHLDTLNVLGRAISKRDSDTDAHNYRVTIMSVLFAEKAGLDRKTIRALIKGAFLHDVGKVGIPDSILKKPGPLTDTEYDIMRSHVDKGLDIISRSEWLVDATDVVKGHHEKIDGTGYPNGLSGEETPLTARIFTIADVFDALTSKRPYKDPIPFVETMNILEEGQGTHFDSNLMDIFKQIAKFLFDEYANRDDEKLKDNLETITQRYFSDDFDSMLFSKTLN